MTAKDIAILQDMRKDIAALKAMLTNSRGFNTSGGGLSVPPAQQSITKLTAIPRALRENIVTIGSAAEGSEAAETTAWENYTLATIKPLDLWVQTRTAYFHAGDKKLYGYFRKLSFDTQGKLYAVSAETRVEIDAAEAC